MPPSFPQPVYAYNLFDGNQEDTAKSLHKTGRQLHLSTPPPRQGDFPAEVGSAPGFFSMAGRREGRRFSSLLALEGSVVFFLLIVQNALSILLDMPLDVIKHFAHQSWLSD